jgi:hypothetical protein
MQAFEIGHFRRVAGFHQGLKTGADQLHQAAAEHGLFAEQVGLALLAEVGLDDARATAADRAGVSQAEVQGVAGGVLVHRDQAWHAAALLVFAAHGVAGALGRDHQHVDSVLGLDQVEVDIQAMGEHQRRAVLDVRSDLALVDVALQFVGREDHQGVGPRGRFRNAHDGQAVGLDLLGGGGVRAKGDGDVLDAAVAKIQRMCAALRAIAYDGDLLVQDASEVGVAVVVDTHDLSPEHEVALHPRNAAAAKAGLSTFFLPKRQGE